MYLISISNNSGEIILPLNPENIPSQYVLNDESFTNINGKVLKIDRGISHKTINVNSHFPKYHFPACNTLNLKEPLDLIKMLEQMKESGLINLVITGLDINSPAYIDSFNIEQKGGGETEDIYYNLVFSTANIAKVRQI